jgi:hypothetical protein
MGMPVREHVIANESRESPISCRACLRLDAATVDNLPQRADLFRVVRQRDDQLTSMAFLAGPELINDSANETAYVCKECDRLVVSHAYDSTRPGRSIFGLSEARFGDHAPSDA